MESKSWWVYHMKGEYVIYKILMIYLITLGNYNKKVNDKMRILCAKLFNQNVQTHT